MVDTTRLRSERVVKSSEFVRIANRAEEEVSLLVVSYSPGLYSWALAFFIRFYSILFGFAEVDAPLPLFRPQMSTFVHFRRERERVRTLRPSEALTKAFGIVRFRSVPVKCDRFITLTT